MTRYRCRSLSLLTLLAAVWLTGCSKDDGPGLVDPGNGNPEVEWTVMVYMAADNNLSVPGILDIDEMEAAGDHDQINVVVQAEFSPANLQQYECDASCFNRPNFNTFRYLVTGSGTEVQGVNGAAEDIGDRDMTHPGQLADFIQWARIEYPAKKYLLVLWNHGGGYAGLLEDDTTAPGHFMSLTDLRAALDGIGGVDVINFDMCLMGAYETLVSVSGYCDYAVFSEEVVPGAGNNYTMLIDALQAAPTSTAKQAADIVAEQFHASYADNRSSTTISAYDLAGLAVFETKMSALADTLRYNLDTLNDEINAAALAAQHYEYSQLKDLGDFLDHLRPNLTLPGRQTLVDEVKTALLSSDFLVKSRARNGTGAEAQDVSGSMGLTVLLPSTQDNMPNQGNTSFDHYQQIYADRPWTLFLDEFLGQAGHVADVYTDLGAKRWEIYLVWEATAMAAGADLDLWVLEPGGDLFIPWLGTVTPNGNLTDDSAESGVPYEGYVTNRYVEVGSYFLFACLYTDPQDYQPMFDVLYRDEAGVEFESLWDPDYPQLNTGTSWRDDETLTVGEILGEAYTDLVVAAAMQIDPSKAQTTLSGEPGAAPTPQLTPAQLAYVRSQLDQRTDILRARQLTAFRGQSGAQFSLETSRR